MEKDIEISIQNVTTHVGSERQMIDSVEFLCRYIQMMNSRAFLFGIRPNRRLHLGVLLPFVVDFILLACHFLQGIVQLCVDSAELRCHKSSNWS
jgi:hypothetical protein